MTGERLPDQRPPLEHRVCLQAPRFQLLEPLGLRPRVIGVGNIVHQAHVRVEGEHRRTFCIRQKLEAVIEVPRLRPRETLTIQPRAREARPRYGHRSCAGGPPNKGAVWLSRISNVQPGSHAHAIPRRSVCEDANRGQKQPRKSNASWSSVKQSGGGTGCQNSDVGWRPAPPPALSEEGDLSAKRVVQQRKQFLSLIEHRFSSFHQLLEHLAITVAATSVADLLFIHAISMHEVGGEIDPIAIEQISPYVLPEVGQLQGRAGLIRKLLPTLVAITAHIEHQAADGSALRRQ